MTVVPARLRDVVVARAGGRCEYCRLSQESQVATFPVDHVMPVVAEGETVPDNLALACPSCNARKWTHVAALDPETGVTQPLFNPRTQAWSDHLRWSAEDPAVIEALTATGRATIGLLELNSEHHRTIRRWLAVVGMHPPD